MKYDELDDNAKRRALDWFRETQCEHGWWEHVYEDAVSMAKLLGIEIDTRYRQSATGKQIGDGYEISFRGFWSQGDGCCFSGDFDLVQADGAEERIRAETNDETLISLARRAQEILNAHRVKYVELRLLDKADEFTPEPRFDIRGEERYWRTKADSDDFVEEFAHLEDDINMLVSGFADWIYKQLEAEYKHLTSDETCEEGIRANDYDFDEEGRM